MRENLEKAAREADKAAIEKEPVTDPETIAGFKHSIETLLNGMEPETQIQVVSELADETDAKIRLQAKYDQIDELNKKLIAANTDLRVELESYRTGINSEDKNKEVSHGKSS